MEYFYHAIIYLIVNVLIFLIAKTYFPSYLKEKGKNLATKEDVREITRISEEIKEEFKRLSTISTKKYELKYAACLGALKIVDAQLSHLTFTDKNGETSILPDRQDASAEEVRQCHNALILTCENQEIITQFVKLITEKQNLDELNVFRNLIREELGFGQIKDLDKEKIWFSVVTCKKENSNQK